VRTHLPLPFHLDEQVGLDLGRIHTLLQIGGYKSLRINAKNDGDSGRNVTAQIIGVNSDGSAIAGAIKTKSRSSEEYSINQSPIRLRKQSSWPDLTITLDQQELQRRILDGKDSVHNPKPWATELNTSIKKGLQRAGIKNLLGVPLHERVLWLSTYAIDTAFSISHTLGSKTPTLDYFITDAIGRMIFVSTFYIFLDSLFSGPERAGNGRRLSVFRGWELDRAVALSAVGFMSTLVKELPKQGTIYASS
jgi:hypothetical protein